MPALRVEASPEGDVVRLVLDRPDKLNALNEELLVDLTAAVADLADRPDVRVAVVQGEGRAFSAGADLRERVQRPEGALARRAATGRWHRLLDAFERLPQVT